MKTKKYKCCLCGKMCEGWGNNPAPLKLDTDKNPNRCCDKCNFGKVLPERIRRCYGK